jgi:hypothetical protein
MIRTSPPGGVHNSEFAPYIWVRCSRPLWSSAQLTPMTSTCRLVSRTPKSRVCAESKPKGVSLVILDHAEGLPSSPWWYGACLATPTNIDSSFALTDADPGTALTGDFKRSVRRLGDLEAKLGGLVGSRKAVFPPQGRLWLACLPPNALNLFDN